MSQTYHIPTHLTQSLPSLTVGEMCKVLQRSSKAIPRLTDDAQQAVERIAAYLQSVGNPIPTDLTRKTLKV